MSSLLAALPQGLQSQWRVFLNRRWLSWVALLSCVTGMVGSSSVVVEESGLAERLLHGPALVWQCCVSLSQSQCLAAWASEQPGPGA